MAKIALVCLSVAVLYFAAQAHAAPAAESDSVAAPNRVARSPVPQGGGGGGGGGAGGGGRGCGQGGHSGNGGNGANGGAGAGGAPGGPGGHGGPRGPDAPCPSWMKG